MPTGSLETEECNASIQPPCRLDCCVSPQHAAACGVKLQNLCEDLCAKDTRHAMVSQVLPAALPPAASPAATAPFPSSRFSLPSGPAAAAGAGPAGACAGPSADGASPGSPITWSSAPPQHDESERSHGAVSECCET